MGNETQNRKDGPPPSGKRFWRRRGVRIASATLAALFLLVVAPLAVILYPTLKTYPRSDFPAAASQLERNRQDLAHLRRLIEVDRSFSPAAQAAFTGSLDAIEQRAGDLDRAGLAMAAAKAVALADNGHTSVVGLVGGHSFNAVPIRLGWFAEDLFVIAATAEQSHLLGGEILEVNGRATEAFVDALRPHFGGPANLAREFVPNVAISPELLHATGLAESPRESAYLIRLKDGNVAQIPLLATPGAPEPLTAHVWPRRDFSPLSQTGRDAGWRHVLTTSRCRPISRAPTPIIGTTIPCPMCSMSRSTASGMPRRRACRRGSPRCWMKRRKNPYAMQSSISGSTMAATTN
ncbi:hypothetical protein ACIQUG_31330 [Ensifer sp. NPDC090286]|uniref:hypothetical protein n=1 Tax=Ensifer sp. NPDC090286 TaxID=3363991 RepID=UPI00383A38E9